MSMRRSRALPVSASISALALFVWLGPRSAGAEWWSFEGRSYYDPLVAGVREPQISALAVAWGDRMAFLMADDDPRRVWDIEVGAELPVLGWESGPSHGGRVLPGHWGAGFWIPIDFHMVEDFVDPSSPIINTDYRFGGMAKLGYGLTGQRWLGLRVFVGHESTHLGDELSVVARRDLPAVFERINVSWEYLDAGILYESGSGSAFWSCRAGGTATLPFRDSYYSTGPGSVTESPLGPVTKSVNWLDPYVGVEAEWEELFDMGSSVGWGPYLSAELRWRSVYAYHKQDPGTAEKRQASLNAIVGVAKTGGGGDLGRASPFFRFYRGVNPHGQFRNQKSFTLYGIGLRLRR